MFDENLSQIRLVSSRTPFRIYTAGGRKAHAHTYTHIKNKEKRESCSVLVSFSLFLTSAPAAPKKRQ